MMACTSMHGYTLLGSIDLFLDYMFDGSYAALVAA